MKLQVQNVSKKFQKKKAVYHVSFALSNGVHAMLGANGSGKTTLMRMLCGLLPMDGGSIHLDTYDITKQYTKYSSHIGYMPQHFGYYPHYSVKDFLEYMALVKGIAKKERSVRIARLLKELHLEEEKNQKMKQLSGGMLRRVGIAQALLNDPDLLILDEPTVGLDPKERIAFRNLIASLSNRCIVLLSTHIVSDIETIADDVLVMKEGEIILHDTCETLLSYMKGKVWEVNLPRKEANRLMMTHTIVKSYHEGTHTFLRIVSDVKPHAGAILVKGDLEDLYVYFFQGGETV